MERVFLGDEELGELQALHGYAQAKAQEARLGQLAVEVYLRWLAARHGLDPQAHYGVSPRGELLALPKEGLALPHGDPHLKPESQGSSQGGGGPQPALRVAE